MFFSSNGHYSLSAYLAASETTPLHQGPHKGEARGCRGLEQTQQLQKLLLAPTCEVWRELSVPSGHKFRDSNNDFTWCWLTCE